jgi:general secretion pathway protein F
MPNYFFRAASLDGEVTEGTTEGVSREAVVKAIQAQGRVPIRVELSHATNDGPRSARSTGLFRRNKDQLLLFTRELSTLLKAGLSLDRSLALLISVNNDPAFSQVLSALQEKIKGGGSFADALAAQQGVFPDIYISLARAGELGGTLELVMARLADHLERSNELKGSLKSAMIYPIILVIVAIVSIIILLTYVIPQFKELFEGMGAALPLSTAIVLRAGDLLKAYGWILAVLIALGALWIRYQLQRPTGQYRWHRRLLSLPLFGDLITKMEVAVFSRTLGTLLQNGIPMVKAMGIVRETLQNRVIADSMDGVINGLNEGARLTSQLKRAGCFPEFSVQMIGVGEESGELESMLLHIAEIYDKEVNRSIKQSLAILEPMLILFLGVIVAGVIMSILVAIMGINQLVI